MIKHAALDVHIRKKKNDKQKTKQQKNIQACSLQKSKAG